LILRHEFEGHQKMVKHVYRRIQKSGEIIFHDKASAVSNLKSQHENAKALPSKVSEKDHILTLNLSTLFY
jgi:hypothetical protein